MRDPRPGLPWSNKRLSIRRKYSSYMDSPIWIARRKYWIAEWSDLTGEPPCCLGCGGEWSDLHHRTYDRVGREQWRDLIPLCRDYHEELHARMEGNPEWRKRPRRQATDALVAHMRRCRKEACSDSQA